MMVYEYRDRVCLNILRVHRPRVHPDILRLWRPNVHHDILCRVGLQFSCPPPRPPDTTKIPRLKSLNPTSKYAGHNAAFSNT